MPRDSQPSGRVGLNQSRLKINTSNIGPGCEHGRNRQLQHGIKNGRIGGRNGKKERVLKQLQRVL